LSGVGPLWDCVSRVCGGGGGCAGGGVPLGAGPCCPDVGRCLSGVNITIMHGYIGFSRHPLGPPLIFLHWWSYFLTRIVFSAV